MISYCIELSYTVYAKAKRSFRREEKNKRKINQSEYWHSPLRRNCHLRTGRGIGNIYLRKYERMRKKKK
jgi:hypothetical protein